ncbi:zinc-binding dehydrogenase [Saccharopolyspora sp. NPDC000995]
MPVAHLGIVSGGYAERAVRDVEALQVLPAGIDFGAAVAMIGTGRPCPSCAPRSRPPTTSCWSPRPPAESARWRCTRNIGATVVGAAGGAAKVSKVREFGADVAVDYTAPNWAQSIREALGGRAVSLVLDGAGGEYGRAAFNLLGPGGRITMSGRDFGEHHFTSDDLLARTLAANVALGPNLLKVPGGMRTLENEALAALADGSLRPLVGPPFALAEAAGRMPPWRTAKPMARWCCGRRRETREPAVFTRPGRDRDRVAGTARCVVTSRPGALFGTPSKALEVRLWNR